MIPGSIVRGAVRAQMEKHAMRGRVKPAIGEKVMGALMPYRGYPWSNDQDRWVQIQHLKNWTGVGIDIIARLAAQLVPNIAYIRPQRTRTSQKWFTHDYNRISNLDFGGHSFVSGSYRRKALGVIKPHEEIEPVEADHPLRLLIENPNAWDTQFDHDYELIMFQYLCGVAYDWAVPNELGYPQELWCIPSHWVWPRTGGGAVVDPRNPYADSLIAYYEIIPWGSGAGYGQSFRLPPDQVIRYAFKSPINKINGYAKTYLGRNWIDADDSIAKSQFAQMSNAALPSFWLELGEGYEDPDDDAIDRISAKFMARYTGEYKTGVPYIGPAGTVPHVLSFPPTQMAYGEAMNQSADRILALLGVPKAAIGMADGMTFGSVLATLYQFCTFTLGPLLTANGQTKTKFLASRFSTARDPIRIWNDDPSPPDPDQLNKDLRTDFDLGLIVPNEGRAIRGRMPYKYGGDDPMFNGPGGMIPMPFATGQDLSGYADMIPLLGRQDNPTAEAEESRVRTDRGSTLNVDEAHSAPRKAKKAFNEADHPRGQPDNAGQFAPTNMLPRTEGNDADLADYSKPSYDKHPLNAAVQEAQDALRSDFFNDADKTAQNIQACVDASMKRNQAALKNVPADKAKFLDSWMKRNAKVFEKPTNDLKDKARAFRETEQALEAHEASEPDSEQEGYEEAYDTWSDVKDDLEAKLEKLNEKADDARERFLTKLDDFNFTFADKVMEARSKGYDPNQPRVPPEEEGGGRFAPVNDLPEESEDDLVERLLKADFTDEKFPDLVKEASKTPEATKLGKKLLKKVEDLKAAQQALEAHEQQAPGEVELPEEPPEEDAEAHAAWEAEVERIQEEGEANNARAERQYEREHDKLGMREGMILDRCNELRDELVSEIDTDDAPESKLPEKKAPVNRIKGLRSCLPSLNGKHT